MIGAGRIVARTLAGKVAEKYRTGIYDRVRIRAGVACRDDQMLGPVLVYQIDALRNRPNDNGPRVLQCRFGNRRTRQLRQLLVNLRGDRPDHFAELETKSTWLSAPCSACERRSAATKAGTHVSSAKTASSDGPAAMSIVAPRRITCSLASVT